ncbi:histidine phosphatase family protein [Bacillus luteolus]|uniref:Histidine phosphatase family protein n=1 Tax=Litchfieldia luteola TaxID=682179 RepID=A0ABR9QMT2_9BACI|nr:histidine phosphatase family protein [Cytobacillus luteolus]MBE4909815.1 histidine phosphatase family protein [Cytobacillus luteolus]MBP1942636.1 2,3-bisphosphoglycerate-dependent phosphoglycerate mutase [Cytobacillus luteolus]
MKTYIYMVRHGDSPKFGDERIRGLTSEGTESAKRVTNILIDEGIDIVVSSPYLRSIQTVQPLADALGQEVVVCEDLKEWVFSSEGTRIPDTELIPLLEKSFSNPTLSFSGTESNEDCQKRAVSDLLKIIEKYRGKKVTIGTHGAVMTLMMGYFDKKYDLSFLRRISKPDIYRMEFNEFQLVEVTRLWSN